LIPDGPEAAIFYSNRAACYVNLVYFIYLGQEMKFINSWFFFKSILKKDNVSAIEDCTKGIISLKIKKQTFEIINYYNHLALQIDSTYVKALNRRATAYEEEKRYKEALLGWTKTFKNSNI